MLLVRDYVGVKAWGEEALQAMQSASREAARTLEDLADIINFALEQLVRQRFVVFLNNGKRQPHGGFAQ
jgi:hypothetical protein